MLGGSAPKRWVKLSLVLRWLQATLLLLASLQLLLVGLQLSNVNLWLWLGTMRWSKCRPQMTLTRVPHHSVKAMSGRVLRARRASARSFGARACNHANKESQ